MFTTGSQKITFVEASGRICFCRSLNITIWWRWRSWTDECDKDVDFNVGCRCWKEKRSMVYLELAKLLIQVPSSSSSWLLVLMILSIAGPKDNVFVYFADHGAKVKDYHVYPSTFITIKMKHNHHLQGLVAFGQDVLKATALNQAIKDMHAAKKYFLSSGW